MFTVHRIARQVCAFLTLMFLASGLWAQPKIDEQKAKEEYDVARAAYEAEKYEEARTHLERAKQYTARDAPGIRILEALLDIHTGKPKTGASALEKERKPATDERLKILDQLDVTRAHPRPDLAAVKALNEDLREANERITQIDRGIERAKTLIARIRIVFPVAEREPDLRIYLDPTPADRDTDLPKRQLSPTTWDGAEIIEVDPGRHNVVVVTIEQETGAWLQVRSDLTDSFVANPQKPTEVRIKLNDRREPAPVAGFEKLNKEIDELIGSYRDKSSGRASRDLSDKCHEKAWKELVDLQAQAQGLRNGAIKIRTSGPNTEERPEVVEDHPEVTKIRHLIQYKIQPCLDDCLNGRQECKAEDDLPMRVWPARGCGCSLLAPQEVRSAWVVIGLFTLLAAGRYRRRRAPKDAWRGFGARFESTSRAQSSSDPRK